MRYYFEQNESTILLFWVGRDYAFTDGRYPENVSTGCRDRAILCWYTKDAMRGR